MTEKEREEFHLQFTIDPADRVSTKKTFRPYIINMSQKNEEPKDIPPAQIKLPFRLVKKD
jgi:hypothetical protein